MMDLHRLRIFLAVYENRGFSEAARKVYLTQPTVSAHIRELEESIGAPLFDRLGREVEATELARVLFPYAKRLSDLAYEAEKTISLFASGEKGTLRLGGSTIPGQYILPRLIGAFKKTYPDVRIVLQIGDTSSVADQVLSGSIEMGMIGAVIDLPGLVHKPCFHDDIVLVVPSGHGLSHRKSIGLEEIRREPLVIREPGSGTRMVTEAALRKAGYSGFDSFVVACEMGSTEAIRQAVTAGVGCGIISRRAADEDVARGDLAAITLKDVDLSRTFHLVTREDRTLSPLAVRFRDFILGHVDRP